MHAESKSHLLTKQRIGGCERLLVPVTSLGSLLVRSAQTSVRERGALFAHGVAVRLDFVKSPSGRSVHCPRPDTGKQRTLSSWRMSGCLDERANAAVESEFAAADYSHQVLGLFTFTDCAQPQHGQWSSSSPLL